MAKRKKNIKKEDLKGDSLTAAPLSSKQGHYYDLGLSGMGTMFGARSMYKTGGPMDPLQMYSDSMAVNDFRVGTTPYSQEALAQYNQAIERLKGANGEFPMDTAGAQMPVNKSELDEELKARMIPLHRRNADGTLGPKLKDIPKFLNGGEFTDAQMAGVQAAAGLGQMGGQAISNIEGPGGRPNVAAQTGGGALSGLAAGAATGASIGTALGTIVPGVGNLVGGAAGAVIGGAAGLIGGTAIGNMKGRKDLAGFQADKAQGRSAELMQDNMAMMNQSVPGVDTSGNYLKYGGKMKANVEIEGGEMVQFKEGGLAQVMNRGGELNQMSSGMYKADGQSHDNGGIKIATDEGRVFSAMTPDGEKMSPAQKAEQVSAELKAFEDRAEKGGGFAKNTLKYMKKGFDSKLDSVYQDQEDRKVAQEEKEFKKGGWMKYNTGGPLLDIENVDMEDEIPKEDVEFFKLQNQQAVAAAGFPSPAVPGYTGNYGIGDLGNYSIDNIEGLGGINIPKIKTAIDPNPSGEKEPTAEEISAANFQRANMLNLAGAVPGMAYNLGKGLFGTPDRLNLGRTSPQNFMEMKRLAAETENVNTAAQLSAVQSAAGGSRKRMSDAAGGDLGAIMRGNLASQNMESSAKSGILGNAEGINRQSREAARMRVMGVLGQQMQDSQRVNLFNMQQEEKENMYNTTAEGAQQRYLSAGLSQLGALGKGLGQTELYKEQLKAIKNS